MRPIKTIIEIRYKTPSNQFDFVSNIINAIGGTPPPDSKSFLGGGVNVQLKNKKITVIVEPKRLGINLEDTSLTTDQLKASVRDLVHRINNHMNWGVMERVGIRTTWIKEVDDFDSFVAKIKDIFFKPNVLLNESIDVAMPLTMLGVNNSKINYNFGVMKKEQLLGQYMEYRDNINVPEVFTLVDFDYFNMLNRNYSKSIFSNFLNEAIDAGNKKAEETFTLLNI